MQKKVTSRWDAQAMVDLHVGGQGIAPIEAVNSLFFSPGAEWESE